MHRCTQPEHQIKVLHLMNTNKTTPNLVIPLQIKDFVKAEYSNKSKLVQLRPRVSWMKGLMHQPGLL